MRSIIWGLALVCLSSVLMFLGPAAHPATAAETYVCWVARGSDGPGVVSSVIRCRIAGRIIRDFLPDQPPPVVLMPAVGTDTGGGCWYRRSWWSGWTLVARYADGSARLRYDPDGVPGGPILADAVLPVCRSEPSDVPPDVEYAWRVFTSMRLEPSRVAVVPVRPVSGLPTYLTVDLTSSHRAALVSPITGHRIEVAATAAEVVVDWGDGSAPDQHDTSDPALGGSRPDAALVHVYEQSGAADIVVRIAWSVSWRVDFGPWSPLPVEPVIATSPVEVDEIVGRLVRPSR